MRRSDDKERDAGLERVVVGQFMPRVFAKEWQKDLLTVDTLEAIKMLVEACLMGAARSDAARE